MKIRYWIVGYTTFMVVILLYIGMTFNKQTSVKRDMVFYNEQVILMEEELANGEDLKKLQEQHGCEILLRSDDHYERRLQDALQREALLLDYFVGDELAGKFVWDEAAGHYEILEKQLQKQVVIIWILILMGGYVLLGFLYLMLLRPFHKLQKFTLQVAKGNLDFPLPVNKHNYFGAFTESFDLMREELKRARECEYQANQSKKELMAELSHDIKTPIATIQATCEVMQIKEKNADTLEKVSLIDAKAKMIQKLVDNLFQATLEELAVLKVEPVEESTLFIKEMFAGLNYYGELHVQEQISEYLVYMDKLRLQQVIDNCLNNAWKYAGTPVHVSFIEQTEGLQIKIRDEGMGVKEDELPLIMEKFYRGSNAKGKAGSGLGLYLAKTFMERMHGDLEYYNEDGFVVQLFLRKV